LPLRLPRSSAGRVARRRQITRISGRHRGTPGCGTRQRTRATRADANWPKLTSFPTHDELQAALARRSRDASCCSIPGRPNGYVREWSPPGLEPVRHFSYAIQWWGFALVLLVLYFGLNFRKVS
jgi:cytochrome oxidase assembly protein ShyY1